MVESKWKERPTADSDFHGRTIASGLGAAAEFELKAAPLLSPMPLDVVEPANAEKNVADFAGGLDAEMAQAMTDEVVSAPPPVPPSTAAIDNQQRSAAAWHDQQRLEAQITGFAVASSKRNADFHGIFKEVGEDDYLIEDYGCALVREILIQGRIYVSENHLCFNSNIFGWVTNVVLPFSEVVSIEKRMTAFVIPNAIQVATLHTKHTFSSFLSRDATFDLIVNIWKLSHPSLPTNQGLDYLDLSEEEDATTAADDGDERRLTKRARLRRRFLASKNTSQQQAESNGATGDNSRGNDGAAAEANADTSTGAASAGGNAGAAAKKAAHPPTKCPCEKDKAHYNIVALDAVYPAKPEKIYNLLFTSGFMKEFWTGNQKLFGELGRT